ncbi:MAG: phosphoadenylyl-sulfate reductase [Burkholderiales bacterium]
MSATEKLPALRQRLAAIAQQFQPVAFASSFGAEDMVLLDIIAREQLPIEVFTLDTGRLPRETRALIAESALQYRVEIQIYRPLPAAVEQYLKTAGLNAFYESVELRLACCEIRKVEPLARALAGKQAWLTGLRREQAASRATIAEMEFDAKHGMEKFNPLIDWTNAEVWDYIRTHNVPYNALHDRGYPSIGCEPCTRAVQPSEDPRAGRWWWEKDAGQKECGLHVNSAISSVPVTVLHQERTAVANEAGVP